RGGVTPPFRRKRPQEKTMKCQDLMNLNLQWVAGDDSVLAAARLMRDQSIGFLLVAAEHYPGHAVRVVTDRDLALRLCAAGRSSRMTRVSEIATREVMTCFELEDLKVAEQKMRDTQKSRLVVVDGLGRAVGVLSLTDILFGDSAGRALRTAKGVLDREATVP